MVQGNTLDRLTSMGFIDCGAWTAQSSGLTPTLVKCADSPNVLYAFVVDNAVKYIGKTVLSLRTRTQRYRTPGRTPSTNFRNNENIHRALESGESVAIYVFQDNGLLEYGGFRVNLAAGLEDSLVDVLKPPWNYGKKETDEPTA